MIYTQPNSPPLLEGFTPHTLFQNDLFPETVVPLEIDPIDALLSQCKISNPSDWTEDDKKTFCIKLAAETWENVVDILAERLSKKFINRTLLKLPSDFQTDYIATLGWLLNHHHGSIPLRLVLELENADIQKTDNNNSIEDCRRIIKSHPVLAIDILDLNEFMSCDTLFSIDSVGGDHG